VSTRQIGRIVAWSAFGAIALTAIAACTLIVDGQFKGYSDTCQIPHIADNLCGQCVAKNCQSEINANCADQGHTIVDSLSSCMQDPSPGSGFEGNNCDQFLRDASVFAQNSGQSDSQFNLRTCVYGACQAQCRTCVDIDAGTSACGSCIMSNCSAMLSGENGCCNNTNVSSGIAECTDPHVPKCTTLAGLANDGGSCSGSEGCNPCAFAQCVYDHCISPGTCNKP
jgi:hypothetical protein